MAEPLATPAPAPGPPTAPAAPPSPPAAPAAPPAPAAQPANLVAESPLEIPDKFKVTKADGTVDHEASLRKTLGSVAHLERRLGSGDIPPENEGGYKLDYKAFPEGVNLNPEEEKAFLKRAHGKGMTNAQVQFVIDEYAGAIKQGLEIQKQQATTTATETVKGVNGALAKAWGENNAANVTAAQRAFAHLADDADRADLGKIGVDAGVTYRILMKVLAKVGAGLSEDTAVTAGEAATINQTLQELRTSKAYLDENDPQHKATVEKVTGLYNKLYPKK